MARRHARGSRVRAIGHPRSYLLPHWISTLQSESPTTKMLRGLALRTERETGLEPATFCLGSKYSTN